MQKKILHTGHDQRRMRIGSEESPDDVIRRRPYCCYGYVSRPVCAVTTVVDIRTGTRLAAGEAAEEFYFRWWSRDRRSRSNRRRWRSRRELVLGYHSMPPGSRSSAYTALHTYCFNSWNEIDFIDFTDFKELWKHCEQINEEKLYIKKYKQTKILKHSSFTSKVMLTTTRAKLIWQKATLLCYHIRQVAARVA